jgi:hypothetical protein
VGEQLTVVFGKSHAPRDLGLKLTVSPCAPLRSVSVRVVVDGERLQSHTIKRGEAVAICHRFPARQGFVELFYSPGFHPNARGLGTDSRALSCRCQSAEFVLGTWTTFALTDRTYAL